MAIIGSRPRVAVHTSSLTVATIVATALAACVGQVGLAIPAVLNGLFQQDLGTTSSQLTWISDAFLVPVTLLELTWGVLGDLFGRKRLLIGTTSQLRDFGFTLGPAVIGAVALSQAAGQIQGKIAASPALQRALATFEHAPAHVPAGQRASVEAAVNAVKSGPLGANGVPTTVPGPKGTPVPFNPLKDIAFHALGQAYSLGYLICGVAALAAALLAATALHGLAHRPLVSEESLAD